MEKDKRKKRKASEDSNVEKSEKLKSKNDKKYSKNIKSPGSKVPKLQQNPIEKKTVATPKQFTLDKFKIKIPQTSSDLKNFPELHQDKQLSIYAYNVNGLRATLNKGTLIDFIKKENPDILCLNETKIDLNTINKEKYEQKYFSDYLCHWNSSKEKAGYSGVAILTKYKPIEVSYGIEIDTHDGEGRVITLEYPTFYLVCVYVPNAGENLKRLDYRVNEWDVEFQSYLNNLKKKKNIILCGDLNVAHKEIDIYSVKGHEKSAGFTKEERESFNNFLESGYIDTFRYLYPNEVKFSYFSARRVTNKAENKGWRLDYFVINVESRENLVDSNILNEYSGSDHTPIKLVYKA